MNNDMMLSSSHTQPPARIDYDPLGASPLGPSQPQPQPLKRIHQSLRGRYLIAFTIAAVCGVIGGALGYMSQQPGYQSDGVIEVTPYVFVDATKPDQLMPGHGQYVATQVTLLQSQRTIQEAVSDPDYIAARRTGNQTVQGDLAAFGRALKVRHQPGSGLIWVSFLDEDPAIASAATRAVISAYMRLHGDPDRDRHNNTKRFFETRKSDDQAQLRAKEQLRIELLRKYMMPDLNPYQSSLITEFVRQETALRNAEISYNAAREALERKDEGQSAELSIQQIADADPTIRSLLTQKENAEFQLLALQREYGENHRLIRRTRADIESLDQRINEHADRFRESHPGVRINPDGTTTTPITPEAVEQLRLLVEDLRVRYEETRQATMAVGIQRIDIQQVDNEIAILKESIKDADRRIDQLNTEAYFTSGRIRVLSHSSIPGEPVIDKRAQFAALGMMGGFSVPFMLFLGIGLLDSRYRYSDDPIASDMSGINLLGILPNLPDRLTDPEQASVAAHCVHQIRTMLQVNPSGMDRRVFAITSASPGDGKTSLSLALGLSFAACGSRTLLIDCDLVGAGLTARLNIDSPDGVLEAVASGSLMEYIRPTDIADLAILPVGAAQGHHASTLSPAALRRMITEARKHYEVILIDTGPILGSIEASLVAAVSDGVILAVARGQQRPLVERSISHLASIGAPLAGVVFNRAQAQDFETSINRRSVKATGAQGATGENAALFGPVARAVASSAALKSDDGDNKQ